MDALTNAVGGTGMVSIALNLVVLISQLFQAKSVAELKVYMHENFVSKRKENG